MNFNKRNCTVFFSILLIVTISMFVNNKINFGKAVYVVSPKEDKYIEQENDIKENISLESEELGIEDEDLEIAVFISGEISTCGVVNMKNDSRLIDAVEKLGGLTQNADMNRVNLAIKLEDGAHYIIPSVEDKEIQADSNDDIENDTDYNNYSNSNNNYNSDNHYNSNETVSSKVNINRASASQLKSLNGIGDVTASRIVEYRSQNGNFKTIDEIMMVKGIGEKKFESIKSDIKVK
ncbi:helix-hairpin-helix domain-containing protein [Tepidibacter aestuarii]|uniref:helix-hairpin-helix domain-containing protein n=1 Tax=Tepidibacter aestuarii TaxID=2925782 RepID=UPI0020C0ECAF|nr:helix-hairpin-helix domain-containing protein [Tepidibacter aestuarii]CAH2214163.1 competence protein ComEA [Tepidibacter aestuarii]